MGAGLCYKKHDGHRGTTRIYRVLSFFFIVSFIKRTYEKCDQSEWERPLFRLNTGGMDGKPGNGHIRGRVRWRIGFEYRSFCICFPEKRLLSSTIQGGGG
jgi:hypothetical protein